MATLEQRVGKMEKQPGINGSRQIFHVISGYTFDVDEDTKQIEEEFVQLHGIDLKDGNEHRFVYFVRSRNETESRIVEGRERTTPKWRMEPGKYREQYKEMRENYKFPQ